MIMINYSLVLLLILSVNSHYGDHQHGKIIQPVVIFKEETQLLTQKQVKSTSQDILWEHVLEH